MEAGSSERLLSDFVVGAVTGKLGQGFELTVFTKGDTMLLADTSKLVDGAVSEPVESVLCTLGWVRLLGSRKLRLIICNTQAFQDKLRNFNKL